MLRCSVLLLRHGEKPKISEDFIRFWIQRFRKLDMEKLEHRKMLIDAFVNAIFLYDEKWF